MYKEIHPDHCSVVFFFFSELEHLVLRVSEFLQVALQRPLLKLDFWSSQGSNHTRWTANHDNAVVRGWWHGGLNHVLVNVAHKALEVGVVGLVDSKVHACGIERFLKG